MQHYCRYKLSNVPDIQIEESDEQPQNAHSWIRRRREPFSNGTVWRALHSIKHSHPIVSTDDWTQIDEREEQPLKAELSIRKR
jgi:hypothetical protein